MIIEVIDERSLFPIIKNDADHTEPAHQLGISLFHNNSLAPFRKVMMGNPIS
jgi:hypothetical protein